MFNVDQEKPRAADVTTIDKDSKWNLLPLILKTTGLTKLQLNSFNDLIDFGLTRIMKANRTVIISETPRIHIQYKSIYVEKPYYPNTQSILTPQACRLSGMTYAGNVYVDYDYINGKNVKSVQKVAIARLPIMLKSNRCHLYNANDEGFAAADECPYDPGCYFIIRGTERVVLVQEQAPYNRILVEGTGTEERQAVVNSSTDTHKTRIELKWCKGNLTLKHNMLNEELPVFIVFRALGVTADQEIIQIIDPTGTISDLLMSSLQESIKLEISTQEEAFQYIERKLRQQQITGIIATKEERALPYYKAREFLRSMFVPHIPSTLTEFRKKAIFFGLMVRWLLTSIRDPSINDSRDFFGNKRLELAGELLDLLFEDLFKNFNLNIQKSVKKYLNRSKAPDVTTITTLMKQKLITDGLNAAISSGNWNITRFKMTRAGVSQPLARLSYLNFLSMITRISSHFEKTQKVSGARSLYPSQFGFVCPSDTPEGAQCGLVKNFSLTAHVTVWADPSSARRTLFNVGVEEISLFSGEEFLQNYVVILNGEPIGVTAEPELVCARFREARRHKWVDRYTAIWTSPPKRCIFVSSESGRVCRPLIIVKNRKSLLTQQMINDIHDEKISFEYLLDNGIIEYIDVNEQHDTLIAFDEHQLPLDDFTHLEIDNAQILGVCAGVIPCPHHNQSPRNTYQCAMGKQAVGPTALNIFNRIDKSTYFLCYPQQPMVQTRTIRLSKYNEMPCGHAAMVAIMSYSGHDIEDALVMNKASLDRGFGRRYYLSKIDIKLKHYDDDRCDRIATINEDTELDRSQFQFENVDDDGLVKSGVMLQEGQVYANKFIPATVKYKEARMRYSDNYPVKVHNVIVANSDRGLNYTIKTRDFRRPELGDKFSSRHGQKGVVGLIVEQEDMPYTETGVYPDIIMNPHGFPSRMTVGKMIELISGKAGIAKGKIGNGTAFSSDRVKDISEDLIAAGFSYSGKEILMSGITGEPLEAYIFFGPVFYQSLKHMVKDKMQARASGRTTLLTRQPTQGRSKKGGMRLGEMERDCLIGHGAANILYERMLISSDIYEADVCENCGLLGYNGHCSECKGQANMKKVRMPYACKLLFQELLSMGVAPRIRLGDF
ncbi:DNA-directed RNA polymerase, beta subunit family protein [Tritrichomonas foetus]|uniref:DNA-directed RNA polymerase subunit beta n=1 Tax=Tritrichomonas foetus TaxID=1144522 RepID=A0A1J4JUG6_9EUKA|nr:DNA-directed RNA polymerase, beta subunit family protein [Tritrichomonas foetus]|eukprot:OHT02643.1 DNA-directed RNA polymerase, beta subunit family protein [Tritrichomonas foetus]